MGMYSVTAKNVETSTKNTNYIFTGIWTASYKRVDFTKCLTANSCYIMGSIIVFNNKRIVVPQEIYLNKFKT